MIIPQRAVTVMNIFRSLPQLASYTGWKYEYVYGEWSDLFEQLKNGDLDLIAGIAYSEDRSDLLSELNMAISVVNEQDAMELDELKNKYYTETTVSVFLSEQEQKWMQKHETVTVGYLDHYLPYCDTESDGSATGLVADIVPDLFHSLPGDYTPKIIYRCFEDQQKMLDSLKNGEVDLVMPISDGKW